MKRDQSGRVLCSAQKDIFEIFSRRDGTNSTGATTPESFTLPLFLIESDGYGPNQGDSLLRKWLLILIGRMWDDFPEAIFHAHRGGYIENVIAFAKEDEDPEVRTAAIYAIGTYMGCTLDAIDEDVRSGKLQTDCIDAKTNCYKLIKIASEIATLIDDACWLVRKEIVYSLQLFIAQYQTIIIRDFQKIIPTKPVVGNRRPSLVTNPRMMNHNKTTMQPYIPAGGVEPRTYLGLLKHFGLVFENPVHIIAIAIVRLAMDPNQEVSRPAHDLFDAVFKEKDKRKDKNSESGRSTSERTTSETSEPSEFLHTKKSPYFKYASKYWLRTLLYENESHKGVDVQMQVKTQLLQHDDGDNTRDQLRNRTRSRPRNREQREREEKVERDLARETNSKTYRRCSAMYNEPITNLKRLVHYGEITEHINDMMFLPYSNALIAAGQTGLYLVDLDHLPYDVQEGEISEAQTRVFGSDKGTTLTSLAVLNQGTKPIITVASNDGSIKLRKLKRSYENRLEIQDNVLTSWKVATNENKQIRNEINIIWNEEVLACSFRDTLETSCITLWDGIQEKRTVNKSIKQSEITCLSLMGDESLKRGPLLIGCDDGSIYRYDMRHYGKSDFIRFGDRSIGRSIAKNRVIGIETNRNMVMVGYSDATVKLWDARQNAREVKKIDFGDNETSKARLSHCFAGSIKLDFFASDVNHEVVVRSFESTSSDRQGLLDKSYPIKNMTSGWGSNRDLDIRNAIFTAVHPFSPYFALATRSKTENNGKGAISVWLPK